MGAFVNYGKYSYIHKPSTYVDYVAQWDDFFLLWDAKKMCFKEEKHPSFPKYLCEENIS